MIYTIVGDEVEVEVVLGVQAAMGVAEVHGIDQIAAPLSETQRDELLEALLQAHPEAFVTAFAADANWVELPPSVELGGQQISGPRFAFDVVGSDSLGVLAAIWSRALVFGAASASVVLVNGVTASCHVVDVRHRHGVLIGLLAPDVPIERGTTLGDRAPVVPKSGRMDKNDVAIITFVDERICQILGYEAADLLGSRTIELIHPDDHATAINAWMEMLGAPGRTTRLRARHRRTDGTWLWMEVTNSNLLQESERCIVTEMLDVSDEMEAIETLRQREQLLCRLTEALPSGVLHVDCERKVVYVNSRLRTILGIGEAVTLDEHLATLIADDRGLLGDALDDVLSGGRDANVEVRMSPTAASIQRVSVAIRVLTAADGVPTGAVLCIDDVTEASALRAELERRATIDELTGCLNRTTVLGELDRTLRDHTHASLGTAVMFIDLDGFKEVNDTFGHKAGDELLAGAAQRLRNAMRPVDCLGRLGGDEFIVVLASISSIDHARRISLRLSASLHEPHEVVAGLPIRIRSSIGVAWARSADVTGDDLTAAADRAMYESKRAGCSMPVCVSV